MRKKERKEKIKEQPKETQKDKESCLGIKFAPSLFPSTAVLDIVFLRCRFNLPLSLPTQMHAFHFTFSVIQFPVKTADIFIKRKSCFKLNTFYKRIQRNFYVVCEPLVKYLCIEFSHFSAF